MSGISNEMMQTLASLDKTTIVELFRTSSQLVQTNTTFSKFVDDNKSTLDSLTVANEIDTKTRNKIVFLFIHIIRESLKYSNYAVTLREKLAECNIPMNIIDTIIALSENTNISIPEAVKKSMNALEIVDAEWRFGVMVSSDDIKRIGKSNIHLKLVTRGSDNNQLEQHHLDMSIPQFYQLLSQLEKTNVYVDMLTNNS